MRKHGTVSPSNLKRVAQAFGKDQADFLVEPAKPRAPFAWLEAGMLYVDLSALKKILGKE